MHRIQLRELWSENTGCGKQSRPRKNARRADRMERLYKPARTLQNRTQRVRYKSGFPKDSSH